MSQQEFPLGWDAERVRQVLAHYEVQDEDKQLAEIEAAHQAENLTMVAAPTDLVPEVRALRARERNA